MPHTDINILFLTKMFFQPFQPNFLFTKCFCQRSCFRHILDIFTSCVNVHIIFAIWYQYDVKIRSLVLVPWYWTNCDVNVRLECSLGELDEPDNMTNCYTTERICLSKIHIHVFINGLSEMKRNPCWGYRTRHSAIGMIPNGK